MDQKMLLLLIAVPLVLFVIVLIAFLILQKKNKANKSIALQKMLTSNESALSSGAMLQKIYTKLIRLPIINRYVYKIRRRLELLHDDDEYTIRNETAKIALKGIICTLVAAIVLTYINREDLFMMIVSLIGVLVVVENLTDMMVNKIEDTLLRQQLELFSEVRHAYHETNMVEEALYEASLLEDMEVVIQADKIYEILISAEPELELEKYYDIAPNRFLKAFAGISYLTKEFGDRKIGGISLYLKNMNNITQELQLEILKRDKLDYLFKSLTYISLAPILFIIPLKNWAMNSFESTRDFYEGPGGFLAQLGLLVLIFLSYSLLKRVKDNSDRTRAEDDKETPWQERVYKLPIIEQFIDQLMPKSTQKEYVKMRNLLKETNSHMKMEWLYVNRVVWCVVGFFASIFIISQVHSIAINNILYSSTTEDAVFGQMSDSDQQAADALTAFDRFFISNLVENNKIVKAVRNQPKTQAIEAITNEMLRINNEPLSDERATYLANRVYRKLKVKQAASVSAKADIQKAILDSHIEMPTEDFVSKLADMIYDKSWEDRVMASVPKGEITVDVIKECVIEVYSVPLTKEQVYSNALRIYDKLKLYTNEYLKWVEIVIALLIAYAMYYMPVVILMFQRKMRAMEMEDEVMQFQTIILMLMYIERISVEFIIEWLARYANIFKEPLAKCLNNYESGAIEALEELKEDAPYKPFVRIVESLQSAVENVKLTDAFDELEQERAFYQEIRKETNERLVNRKAKIGRIIGFAPMVTLFVGYLIVPLMWSSVMDMGTYFSQMGSIL